MRLSTSTRPGLASLLALALVPSVGDAPSAGVASAPALAPRLPGDGGISDGKLDLLVYFTYPEADPEAWVPVFEAYSELLNNATEGGLQLGRVQFTRCSALADEADVWVLADNSGARAHIGGLGRSGQHITISQTHRSSSGFALGQFGLAHETGHYVWSLYDEYLGFVNDLPSVSSLHYCATPDGDVGCLMDGGTTVFPNNQRSEFCTEAGPGFSDTAHNFGQVDALGRTVLTDQQYVYDASCWTRIQADGDGGLQHPAFPPDVTAPAHDAVEFDLERYLGPLAMALVLDTSGSMSAEQRLEGAIEGSQMALGLLRDGEQQAVYHFDDRVRGLVGPEVVTAGRRSNAVDRLETLVAEGGTQAGEALLEVAGEFEDVDACRRFAVLLTDGISSAPDVDEPEVLLALESADLVVYPVALGSFPDDAALLELASATGGQLFHAPRPQDVAGAFAQIFTLAGGGSTVGTLRGPALGPGVARRLDVEVPASAEALVLGLALEAQAGPVLELLGPGGERIRSGDTGADLEWVQSGDVLRLRVDAPRPGTWTVAFAAERQGTRSVTLHAAVESPTLQVATRLDRDVIAAAETTLLEVAVVEGLPVAGASVRGTLVAPDGTTRTLELRDDGHPASGDRRARDGVYSMRLSGGGLPGLHRLDLDVRNVDGVAASNRECGRFGFVLQDGILREEGAEDRAIPPFRVQVTRSFLVTEDEAPAAGTVTLERHAAASSGAPGFRLRADADEPLRLEALRLWTPGDPSRWEGLELHADADEDGRLDRPRRPLARARVADGFLLFERGDGALLRFQGEDAMGFVLVPPTAWSASEAQAQGDALGGTLGASWAPRAGGPTPSAGERLRAAGLLASVLALLIGVGAAARSRGAFARRCGMAGVGATLLLLAAIPACSGGGSGEDEPTVLDPNGVDVRGEATEAVVTVRGGPLDLPLR